MAVRIQAGWTFGASIPSATFTVTETTGGLDFDVTCDGSGIQYDDSAGGAKSVSTASTQWSHETMSAVLSGYAGFAAALQSAINSASGAHGNSWTYSVLYSGTAQTYTISSASGTFAIAWADPATSGVAARRLLGFTATATTANTHVGTARPYYSVIPYLDDKSRVSGDYEQGSLIRGAIAGDGQHYSVSPQALPTLYDFTMEFEMDPATAIAGDGTAIFARDATAAVPWAWEDFFKHCRASEPFICVDDTESTVHYLRPEAAHFDAKTWRRQTDWDKFDVPLATYLRGRL